MMTPSLTASRPAKPAAAPPPKPAPREAGGSRFRLDIEGLRGIAVLVVVLWHAGLPVISGGFVGVDVFFVISGFLITGLLVKDVSQTGAVRLGTFYLRRARRLLPSAALVLLVTAGIALLVLPRIRWRDTAWDVISSATYVINWRLAEQSVDYLSADQAPSILQHYWSLAVEEQFYLAWPVLIALMAWLCGGRRRRRFTAMALVAITVIGALSFAWSVIATHSQPERAYFVTTTRVWELALGALLALLPIRQRLSPVIAAVLGWVGLAAIFGSAMLLDTTTPFPGVMALPATVGTALVLAAGASTSAFGAASLLAFAPLRALGKISYTLYLWHWPVLIGFETAMGRSHAVTAGAVVVSVILAYLTSRFVERPIWHARILTVRPAMALAIGVICTMAPVVAGTAMNVKTSTSVAAQFIPSTLGAAVLTAGDPNDADGMPVDRVDAIVPDPIRARDDVPTVYADGCHAAQEDDKLRACVYGGPDAGTRVAVLGDSHAAQWVPALQRVGRDRGWSLSTYTKSQCPFLDVEVAGGKGLRPHASCAVWNAKLLATLRQSKPDLIVTTSFNYSVFAGGSVLSGAENRDALVASMRRTWADLAGIAKVVVLKDTPAPRIDIADCVARYPGRLTQCAVARDAALAGIGPLQIDAAKGLPGVHLLDLNDVICPADRCAAVIGGVLVYRDVNHLTATYAWSLGGHLDERIARTAGA